MKKYLDDKLKEVKNYKDFKAFMKLLKEHDYRLFSKRSGRYVFLFREDYNPNKAHYLIDDGVSVGHCRWGNLYKYLEVNSI